MYLSLEKLESNLEFWRALLIVSSASLEALRNERAIGSAAFAAQSRSNETVKTEITRLLSGKSYDQLVALQGQVQRKLASDERVDVEYWEGLLKELIVWKAKGKLRDMHEVVLSNRLEQLRRKQRDEAIRHKEEIRHALQAPILPSDGEDDDEEDDDVGAAMEIEQEIVQEAWDPELEPVILTRLPEDLRSRELLEVDEEMEKLVCVSQRLHFFFSPPI